MSEVTDLVPRHSCIRCANICCVAGAKEERSIMSTWPVNYREQLSGSACSICAEGRPEEIDGRIRFFSSMWSDGYLHLRGVQRGYAAVIWRGKHVVEPTELAQEEAVAFWFDVLQVS